jgi:2-polyprenyl-3-methyl-5-hydroxy-6-metoxy-1,4-benzoquinol methylase
MRALMRKVIRALVTTKATWLILNGFYRFFHRFRFEKDLVSEEQKRLYLAADTERMKLRFRDLTVQYGPFKGMKYAHFVSHGSALFPKLLGSYECELHEEIYSLLNNNYDKIVDIGCAEGYYAVGMALKQPEATVYAYDIDASALEDCRKTASVNKVTNIKYIHGCSSQKLLDLKLAGSNLVISDCEGFELELFTESVVKHFENCDLLIEMHDNRNELISPTLNRLFKQTHDITIIPSMNTFVKFEKFDFGSVFTQNEIGTFFSERTGYMNWGIFQARK